MTIEDIVKFYGGTDAAAAKALGVARERVGFIRRHGQRPPLSWQRKCEADSKGKLKASVCKRCGQVMP